MGFQTQSGPASTHDKQDMTTINQKQWKYVPMLAYDRQVARQLLAIVTAPTWAPQGTTQTSLAIGSIYIDLKNKRIKGQN